MQKGSGLNSEADRGVRHLVAVFLAVAAASAYLTRHCLAAANTSMQTELGFNNEQFGYLYSAFSLGYLLFQIPGGWLGQRFGTRSVMPALSILWSALTLLVTVLTSLPGIVAARFAYGLCQAGLIPNQAKVVRDWFPVESRGQVSGIIGMAMSLGGVITMSLTAYLLDYFNWRAIFSAYSLVGVAWAIAFYWFFRTLPAEHPRVSDCELARINGSGEGDLPLAKESSGTPWKLFASLAMWALCGQLIFRAAGYNFFVTFYPAFLEYAYQLEKSNAGMLTAWPLIGVVVGAWLGGWLVDRVYLATRSRFLSRSGVAIAALTMTALLTLLSTAAGDARQLTLVISLGAFFSGLSIACPWAAIVDISGKDSAIGMGIINSAGCLAGVVISPAVGRMIDHIKKTDGDWNRVIYLHAAFYAVAVIFWLFVRIEPARPAFGTDKEGPGGPSQSVA